MGLNSKTNVWDAVIAIAAMLYSFAVFSGTAYLVSFYNWSPWWFALSIFLASVSIKTGGKSE